MALHDDMALLAGMGIADQVRAVDADLKALRHKTMDYSYLTPKGTVAVRSCPELDAILGQLLTALAMLARSITSAVNGTLAGITPVTFEV